MDLSALSDQDLLALKSQDYSKLSDAALLQLKDHSVQQAQESGLDKAVRYSNAVTSLASAPFNWLQKNMPPLNRMETLGSPQQLLQSVPQLASQAAGKVGEWAATKAAGMGMDPRLAAAAGTLTAMGPDMTMTIAPGEAPTAATEAAVPVAEHALGLSKKFRNTDVARASNANAARVALENNVIPMSGNLDKMMANAKSLASRAGDAMNEVFQNAKEWKEGGIPFKSKAAPEIVDAEVAGQPASTDTSVALNTPSAGPKPAPNLSNGPTSTFEQTAMVVDPKKMIKAVEELRPGKKGGFYDQDNAVIDDVVNTIKAHGPEPITLQEANAIKTRIQREAPYGTPGHELIKDAAHRVLDVVDSSLNDLANKIGDSALAQKFQAAKRAYGASQRIQQGVNNRLSTLGNNIVNPMSVLGGIGTFAGSMAAHSTPIETGIATALATGAGMIAKKAGTSIGANLINQVGQSGRLIPGAIATSTVMDRLAQARKRRQ